MSSKTKNTASTVPEGWVEIHRRLPLYSAERGAGGAVQGWLLALNEMPPNSEGRPWKAFTIRLTEPAKASVREGASSVSMEVPAGEEILVPATTQLERKLGRAVGHPDGMFEVYIRPKPQMIPTKLGRMVDYDVRVNPAVKPRDESAKFAQFMSGEAALLAEGEEAIDESID